VTRAAWKRCGCLLGVLGLAAAVALFPTQGITWDGGFPSMEYTGSRSPTGPAARCRGWNFGC
jgi:hypothetical protein